jgi:hypothetical protein
MCMQPVSRTCLVLSMQPLSTTPTYSPWEQSFWR